MRIDRKHLFIPTDFNGGFMTVSSWDDYPVHQSAHFISHPATSDRNFYDRYYFNLHSCSNELFAIFGLGQYPNLGVTDAFIDVRHKEKQHIVRSSTELLDRSEIKVGPISIEVIEPLEKLRVRCEPSDHSVSMDVIWEASMRAHAEPNQYIRNKGRVVFDTQRFAQNGRWTGEITVDGQRYEVSSDTWWGARDRSWGIRPVGEPEGDGIRQGTNVMSGMWNYFPMQFEDHSILYMCHEQEDGTRLLEEAVRIWHDSNETEWLGRPEWEHEMISGTRLLERSKISFNEAPGSSFEIECESLLPNWVSIGTGYGIDSDWRHGMHQGKDVVQGLILDVDEIKGLAQYGIVDHVGRFSYEGNVGYGLYEHGFFGPFMPMGLEDRGSLAP
tara:strand:- start:2153 stop:3307 length:1155 start_codon:yes stop_codon:yes gene_type:complete